MMRITDEFAIQPKWRSEEEKKAFADSLKDSDTPKYVIVNIAATHAGYLNKNKVVYNPAKMRRSVNSWIEPNGKPVLTHHNKMTDPVGRIQNAEYISLGIEDVVDLARPKGYIQLAAKITDPDAIQKILDERYLTVSIGGSSDEVKCSICNHNVVKDGICEHKKGKEYDGKLCFWNVGEIEYSEVSFVNTPADVHAKIEGVQVKDSLDLRDSFLCLEDIEAPVEELEDTGSDNLQDEDEDMNKKATELADILSHEFSDEDVEAFLGLDALLDEMLGDAKMSSEKRKSLPDSAFCGPNRSFPIPDCAHVTAARRLIGRAKVSDGTKQKILACVARKAKNLGCNGESKDQSEDSLPLSDLMNVWIADLAYITELEDRIVELSNKETEDTSSEELTALTDKVTNLNETIEDLGSRNTDLKKQLSDMQTVVDNLEAEKETLLDEKKNLLKQRHDSLAERVVDLKIALGKPDVVDVASASSDEERKTKRQELIDNYKTKSTEFLEGFLDELSTEMNALPRVTNRAESNGAARVDSRGEIRSQSRKTGIEIARSHLGIGS